MPRRVLHSSTPRPCALIRAAPAASVHRAVFGIGLGWVYLFMGIAIGSGVIPVALCLTWSKTNGMGATISIIIGSILAVITWTTTASGLFGVVSVDTLGRNEPMLAGNMVAIFSSGLITVIWSLIAPEDYDFESMKRIPVVEQEEYVPDADETPEKLMEAREWIIKWGWIVSLILIIMWPVATIPWGVLPRSLFAIWSSVAVVWGFLATVVIIVLPIYESKDDIMSVCFGLLGIKVEPKARLVKQAGYA